MKEGLFRGGVQALTGAWGMRFYFLGLAVQKGLPILILPLIVAGFGRGTYASYVIIYTIVQSYAVISGAAIPQTIVPLWFRQDDHAAFMAVSGAAVLLLSGVTGIVVFVAGLILPSDVAPGIATGALIPWVIAFAFASNLNQMALGVARSQDRQAAFLWSSLAGAVILLVGVIWLRTHDAIGLPRLIGIQLAALTVTSLLLIGPAGAIALQAVSRIRWAAIWPLLKFSLPLAAYSLLVTLAASIDKWFAKAFFDPVIFRSYVIDFQCAFSTMFVPVAVGLYNGPRISALVAAGDAEAADAEQRRAQYLSMLGVLTIAIGVKIYALVTGLQLTVGYWALVLGFIFEGHYVVKSNRVMAQMRSRTLASSTSIAFIALVCALWIAGTLHSVTLLYSCTPAYFALMLLLVSRRKIEPLVPKVEA